MANQYCRCLRCGGRLNVRNKRKHTRKVHSGNPVVFHPCGPPRHLQHKKRRKQPHKVPLLKAPPNTQDKKEELCPVCFGDGGVNGGCYKCENGWVSSSAKKDFTSGDTKKYPSDNTRISNANYTGDNIGAHYRDRDGRFGSNPEHDDYSDEGEA